MVGDGVLEHDMTNFLRTLVDIIYSKLDLRFGFQLQKYTS